MLNTYRTVKIEGNEYIHIIKGNHPVLCDISLFMRTTSSEFGSREKEVTEVNKPPTCPKCIQECLNNLNYKAQAKQAKEVITKAYTNLFSSTSCQKGKCHELHKEITKSNHSYPYIPNNHKNIANYLDDAFHFITTKRNIKYSRKRYQGQLRFLDAGCGIGNIVTLAHAVGFKAHGIELNTEYLKIARKMTTNLYPKPYFECADIITFDKYHRYNLIYYYVPINDNILQTALEFNLIRGMEVGSYMMPTGRRRGADSAVAEGYFEGHTHGDSDRFNQFIIFEKIREVPKDWIPNKGRMREEYKDYVASKQKAEGGKN